MDFLLDLLQGAGIAAADRHPAIPAVLLTGALASADVGSTSTAPTSASSRPGASCSRCWSLVMVLRLRRPARRAVSRRPAAAALRARRRWRSRWARSLPPAPSPTAPTNGGRARSSACSAPRSASRPRARSSAACAAGSTRRPPRRCRVYAEGAAVAAAGLSILFPPLALLVIGALVWLLAGGRRREREKYAGLRILR